MAGYRADRLNEDFKREVTAIISELKDPRVSGGLVSVVRVELTNDLSYAKIFVSSIDGLESAKNAVLGLKSAEGFIKRQLSGSIELRKMPSLKFIADDSILKSAEIIKKLNDLKTERKDED